MMLKIIDVMAGVLMIVGIAFTLLAWAAVK
jgi:hypothetical protein